VYEFWSGKREKLTETRHFDRVKVTGTYSDLAPINVFVCNSCAAGLRRRKYLPGVIGWGILALPCLPGMAIIPFLGFDQASGLICLGGLGFFAIPAALLLMYNLWQMFRPVPESEVTDRLVLNQVRTARDFGKRGYEFFTQGEYQRLFNR
jgi:hypothetical protein